MEDTLYIIIILALVLEICANKLKKKKAYHKRKNSNKKKNIFSDLFKTNPSYNETEYNYTPTPETPQPEQPQPEAPQPEPEEKKEEPFDFSYMPYKKRLLLTKTEYAFYTVLVKECYKRKLLVCPKVRLEDLVYITDKEHPFKYRGYVKSRHVDFVITDIRLNALAAIELDDPSHNTYKAAKTDRFKNELFKTINTPLIRIKTGTDYLTQITVVFDNLNFNANTTMSKTQP